MPKLKVGVCDGEGGVLVSTAGDGVIAVGLEGSKGVQVGEPRLETRSVIGVPVGVDTGKLQPLMFISRKLSAQRTNQTFLTPCKVWLWVNFS